MESLLKVVSYLQKGQILKAGVFLPILKTAEYTRYMVNKPFPVSEGQAAPFYWFNSSGGGTQYYLKNDISYYIEKGYIKIIK